MAVGNSWRREGAFEKMKTGKATIKEQARKLKKQRARKHGKRGKST